MKLTTFGFLAFGALLLLQSCKSNDDSTCCPPPYQKGHYIQYFMSNLKEDGIHIEDSKMKLTVDSTHKTIQLTTVEEGQLGNCLSVMLAFEHVSSQTTAAGQLNPYYSFASSIKDTHYPLTLYRSWLFDFPTAIVDSFQSVKLLTNQNYSSDFLAGSDVSSLFFIYFEDPLRTIQNNYQSVTASDSYQDLDYLNNNHWKAFPHTITGKTLSEIDFSQKSFIGAKWFLIPNIKPDLPGDYVFTLQIKTKEGKIIQQQTKPFSIK